jgi:hypothetical protein
MTTSPILIVLALQFLLTSAQRVIKADLWKPSHLTPQDLVPRQDPFTALLTQKPDKSMYWINITIGTPGQGQSLQLDTGSRNLWIPASGSAICSSSLVDCASLGSFDKIASSTYETSGQSNTISYGDGSSATGILCSDIVRVGGQAISNQLATLATQGTAIHQGVLGLGWPASYPTVNHNLAAQGLIPSNQFSLWLNDVDAATGTILFGGIDRSKFVAPLVRVPLVGSNLPAVTLTRITILDGRSSTVVSPTGYYKTVILDTGTSLTVLPNAIASKIVNAMGAQYYPTGATSGTTIIPCSQKNENISLNFHFGGSTGPTINVDISQLVLRYLAPLNSVDMCQFGLYGSDGSYPTTLGDSFLRSAYVVYDVQDGQIGLAQSVLSGGGSDVVELL